MTHDERGGVLGFPFVVSAPSGAGKTSILSEVLKRHPECAFSVSVTTRSPRNGEVEGVNYHFVDDAQFDTYLHDEALAEWAVVYDCRYGTLKETIDEALKSGVVLILDTDTVGAFNLKELYPDAVLVFIAPPSPDVLRERLQARNTETSERIQRRLDAAPGEMARMAEYDYIVVNDNLAEAVDAVDAIITAEGKRSPRVLSALAAWSNAHDR